MFTRPVKDTRTLGSVMRSSQGGYRLRPPSRLRTLPARIPTGLFSALPNSVNLPIDKRDRGSPSPSPSVTFVSSASGYATSQPPAPSQMFFDKVGYRPSAAMQDQFSDMPSFDEQMPTSELPTESQCPMPEPLETGAEGVDNLENMNQSPEDQVLQGLGVSNRISSRLLKNINRYKVRPRKGLGQWGDALTTIATQTLGLYQQSLQARQAKMASDAQATQRAQMLQLSQGKSAFATIPIWVWIAGAAVLAGGGFLLTGRRRSR